MAREPQVRRKSVNDIQAQVNRIVGRMIARRSSLRHIGMVQDIGERYMRNAANSRQALRTITEALRDGVPYGRAMDMADDAKVTRGVYTGRYRRRER